MLRTAFRPRWWPRHLLLVVLVGGFCFLGRWQWDVSQSARGTLQNTLYAFQWWAMALIVIYGWWRLLYEDAHPERRPTPGGARQPVETTSMQGEEGSEWADRWTAQDFAVPVDEEPDDPELAAYNDYLARLNARAERR